MEDEVILPTDVYLYTRDNTIIAEVNDFVLDIETGHRPSPEEEEKDYTRYTYTLSDWQQMKDAPKDGTYIDIWVRHHGSDCDSTFKKSDCFYSTSKKTWCDDSGDMLSTDHLFPLCWLPSPNNPDQRFIDEIDHERAYSGDSSL